MIISREEIIEALKKGVKITKWTWKKGQTPTEKNYEESDLNESHKIRLHAGFLLKTLSPHRWIDPTNPRYLSINAATHPASVVSLTEKP
jgi:hypothetical protein